MGEAILAHGGPEMVFDKLKFAEASFCRCYCGWCCKEHPQTDNQIWKYGF